MDYKEFMKYMDANGTSEKEAVNGLQNYVREFPYFQTAQALLAKAFREQEHVRFDKQLKIAAAYCSDRKSLYALIHHRPSGLFMETKTNNSPFISEQPISQPPSNPFTESPAFELPNDTFTENNSHPISVFEPITSKNTNEKEEILFSEAEEEIVQEKETTPVSSDPRDIIRERLKEILNKQEDVEEPKIEKQQSTTNEIISPLVSIPSAPVEKEEIVSEPKIGEQIEIPEIGNSEEEEINPFEPQFDSLTVEANEEEEEEEEELSNNNTESVIQNIFEKSATTTDDVGRGELEYALESTIIQSLEKLPLLDESKSNVSKEEVEISPEPMGFMDWLKLKKSGDFGKVEEVHAYESDGTSEVEVEASSIVKEESQKETIKDDPKESQKQPSVPAKIPQVEKLIDTFIATEPRIVASKTEFYSPANQAKKSLIEHEDLVSETLARIYRHQGAFLKARSAYQKLILLHPEKKAYFAALIEEIDNQYNNPDKQDL